MSTTTTVRFRYDRDRWKAVQAKAAAEGRTASVIMRKLLDGWLDEGLVTRAEVAAEVAGVVGDALAGWAKT